MKELNQVIHADCLSILKEYPDHYFDLCLTDPPYGININKMSFVNNEQGGVARRTNYKKKADWDSKRIGLEYITEIQRVSKNQIIWGGNYYTDILPPTPCWIIWDKKTEDKYSNDFADCEMAWTSFDKPARVIRYLWQGMLQGNSKQKEIRVHPTQKPVYVMARILELFATPNMKLVDPFCGSGTTLQAAQEFGLDWLGIDISEENCTLSKVITNSCQQKLNLRRIE